MSGQKSFVQSDFYTVGDKTSLRFTLEDVYI